MHLSFDTISALLERHGRYLDDCASTYGEPGYSDPQAGILFANWNDVPRHIINGLERRGFELEWSDEWCTDSNGRAYRTSPDSYGWRPSYVYLDGEILGRDEARADPSWYVEEYLLNDPDRADTFDINLAALGFTMREQCEHGWHPGQTDDPKKIYAELEEKFDVVFQLDSSGQFDIHFSVWVRPIAD